MTAPFTPEQSSALAAVVASEMLAQSLAMDGSPIEQAILRARIEMHQAAARYYFVVAELKASSRSDKPTCAEARRAPQQRQPLHPDDQAAAHGSEG